MKYILYFIIATLILALTGCTNSDDFEKGRLVLENMGYTNIEDTGYSMFGCSDSDDYSSGFTAVDKQGRVVEGVICSGFTKGVTVRFN